MITNWYSKLKGPPLIPKFGQKGFFFFLNDESEIMLQNIQVFCATEFGLGMHQADYISSFLQNHETIHALRFGKLLWFSKAVPKRAFICWLPIRNGLTIRDRLAN